MTNIKDINLSEKDFDLIIDGLETLPEKGQAGELMFDLFTEQMVKDDDDAKKKLHADREKRKYEKEQKNALLKEDIRILQGKLLMLKRFMLEQGALNEANGIINDAH